MLSDEQFHEISKIVFKRLNLDEQSDPSTDVTKRMADQITRNAVKATIVTLQEYEKFKESL